MRADRSRLPDVGADPQFAFPDVARHTLSNGLQVRTIEHPSVPIVTFVLQVDGGSGADPSDKEGLAAIVADMVDEGTGSLNAIEVSDALARIGADYDVDVGADATVFSLTTLSRFAQRGASLLADLVTRPSLRDDDFTRVRQLRLDRLRQLNDLPPAVAERAFLRLLYQQHPYGHLPIGNDQSLRAISLADVSSFHSAAYAPGRATLIAAGAMSHDELRRTAEDAFGKWQTDAAVAQPRMPATSRMPVDGAGRLAVVPRDGAAQSELRIGHLSARRDTPDYPALLVMNALLGGQFVSRINLKLREEKGYTYGARTGFDWRRELAPFVLQASVHTAATADAVKDSLAEIDGIRGSRPPSVEELALARASLTRGYPRNFETAQQVARGVAQLVLYNLPDTYFEEFIPKVNGVTADQVVAAASRYLDPRKLTTLIVGDHGAIGESLAALGLGAPEVLPKEV
jgi:predicted Zn-dependent peptidase